MYGGLPHIHGGHRPGRRTGRAASTGFTLAALLLAGAALLAPGAGASAPALPSGCTGATLSVGNSTPAPIVNGGPFAPPVISTIQVAGAQPRLRDVDLVTDISHTHAGDLDVTLTSPAGTVVTITTDNGGTAANTFGNGISGTRWDDDAPQPVSDAVLTPNVPSPTLQPEEAMAAFIGENPNGTWTLAVADDALPDDGRLNSWSLDLATFGGIPTIASANFAGAGQQAIPNPGTISPTATVSGAGTYLGRVELRADIPHAASGDLQIQLRSPGGTITQISTENGAVYDNVFGDGPDGNDGSRFFDDAGDLTSDPGGGPVTDAEFENNVLEEFLVPEGAMGAFIGENPNGAWALDISDIITGQFTEDGGSLEAWTLTVDTISGCTTPPPNQPPDADAGGPYAFSEGDGLSLDASGSSDPENDTLSYTWDVNDDGVFGDATGPSPSLTAQQLRDLGVDDGPANRQVHVQVLDGNGSDTASADMAVTNVAPSLEISGPAAATAGDSGDWTFTATDPSGADQAGNFGFKIDWDGDGTVDQTAGGASPLVVPHTYPEAGSFTIRATPTDKDAGEGDEATLGVEVAAAPDPPPDPDPNPKPRKGRCANTLNGTPGSDALIGSRFGDRIFGFRGNDRLIGGRGDDCLWGQRGADVLKGNKGRDVLRGSAGPDRLAGGGGRDVIRGGFNADRIFANDGKRDTIFCGPGRDVVNADRRDRLFGCEVVRGPARRAR